MNIEIIIHSSFLITVIGFCSGLVTMSVERVGVSFEPVLLNKFDILMKRRGYTNRSEAIRDLVRKEIIESGIKEDNSEVIGTLTIIYDHEIGNITDKLLHLQHHHHNEITFTTHIHIDDRTCLEIVVIRGQSSRVKKFAENVKALKGVKHGQLAITKTSF
jgi:CopG family nickel-responsive transcriptional regulator